MKHYTTVKQSNIQGMSATFGVHPVFQWFNFLRKIRTYSTYWYSYTGEWSGTGRNLTCLKYSVKIIN